MILLCLCFCFWRGCCNSCGKRWATRYYSNCDIRAHAAYFVLLTAALIIICAYAWTANVSVAEGVDGFYDVMDGNSFVVHGISLGSNVCYVFFVHLIPL